MAKFQVVSRAELKLATGASFVLVPDEWNDFGFRTQFMLFARSARGLNRIGRLKILKLGEQTTDLPETFDTLDASYCSLGEDAQFYEKARATFGIEPLEALNDIVLRPSIADGFESDVGFRRSLLRFLPAESVFATARGESAKLEFEFSTRLLGFTADHVIKFDFSAGKFLNRIVLLAGNNGCGKSGILANLAYALSGERPDAGAILPRRPHFRKVLVLSYSLFQPFKSIVGTGSAYVYCGLVGADPREILDPTILSKRHAQSLKILTEIGRIDTWLALWRELCRRTGLEGQGDSLAAQLSLLGTMSSGHRIYAQIVVDLLCHLEPGTLVVFDEPELHLHPALIAHLMRTLTALLERFDAFAVVATHSPVVVQEIPGSNVVIIDRIGSLPVAAKPNLETFGATLTEISDIVFRMSSVDRNYISHVKDLLRERSVSEVKARFLENTSINLDVVLRID